MNPYKPPKITSFDGAESSKIKRVFTIIVFCIMAFLIEKYLSDLYWQHLYRIVSAPGGTKPWQIEIMGIFRYVLAGIPDLLCGIFIGLTCKRRELIAAAFVSVTVIANITLIEVTPPYDDWFIVRLMYYGFMIISGAYLIRLIRNRSSDFQKEQ